MSPTIEAPAKVFGRAKARDNAQVFGDAWVSGTAQVSGDAQVSGNARVFGDARVSDNAQVSGNARVFGDAQVSGDAWVVHGCVADKALVERSWHAQAWTDDVGDLWTVYRTRKKPRVMRCSERIKDCNLWPAVVVAMYDAMIATERDH